MEEMDDSERIFLPAMAVELGRQPHTIRQWLREKEREPSNPNNLPSELIPHRKGGLQQIFWTHDQLEGMRAFAEARAARRGWRSLADKA